jgi:membrane-anchored glycerophosphoryl diester phosphodiesterase (GDPDase)
MIKESHLLTQERAIELLVPRHFVPKVLPADAWALTFATSVRIRVHVDNESEATVCSSIINELLKNILSNDLLFSQVSLVIVLKFSCLLEATTS